MALKKSCDFDTEHFIMEIQKRSSIWDLSSQDYSNRDLKKKQWEELVEIFGGHELNDEEKRKLGITLQTRWRSIRDSHSRELRRLKKLKSGSAAERRSPYVYSAQLSFLNRCSSGINTTGSTTQETAGSIIEISNEKPDGPYDIQQERFSRKKSKQKKEDPDIELAAALKASLESRDKREAEAEAATDRLFLLSLLSDLKKVAENEKLATKLELMSVIRKKLQLTSANNFPQQTMYQSGYSQWGHNPPFFGSAVSSQSAQIPSQQYSAPSMMSEQQIPSQQYLPPPMTSQQRPMSQTSASSVETDISVTSPESELLQLF